MTYMMKSISLSEQTTCYDVFDFDGSRSVDLSNLAKVNIFVGANNSGKSRFMRGLASTGLFSFEPAFDIDEIQELKKELEEKIRMFASQKNLNDIAGLMQPGSIIRAYKYFREGTPFFQDLEQAFNLLLGDQGPIVTRGRNSGPMDSVDVSQFKKIVTPTAQAFKKLTASMPKQVSFKKVYIPSLRGLRTLPEGHDYYKERTLTDYFPVPKDKQTELIQPEVFTGLKMYEVVRDHLLGDLTQREKIAEFQSFLSNTFFERKQVALIPRVEHDVVFVKIGKEREFPIYNLGDGIQSIIVLTFPLFLWEDEYLLVFVEEPEMFIHPGLQRIYLETIGLFEKHQFFFTTHSNHFLDLTLDFRDTSVYSFSKKVADEGKKEVSARFEIRNVSNESRRTLELLGVRNSSVLLSNCTIWVEGITDRRYVGHYLNLYQEAKRKENQGFKSFDEDRHYSFIEYSGSNIRHWSFLDAEGGINVDRLCGSLFLISDQDNECDGMKRERQQKLAERLGDRYFCLPVREIENLLSPEVLRKVIAQYEGDETLPDFTKADYMKEPLGQFIETTLLGDKKKRLGRYAEASGTISQKVAFCDKALRCINDLDDMTDEAKDLAEKVYTFIKNHNV